MFKPKDKLKTQEKLDFLEYLAFQIKTDMGFEKALSRYYANKNRKPHVLNVCSNTIQDIKNGKSPADALYDNHLIERLEYGIVKNGKSNKELYESLLSIININKGNIDNQNALEKAIRSGVMMVVFIFLAIPLFKNEIITLYGTFEQMQEMTGKKDVVIEIPFLVKYWWASFLVIGAIAFVYQGIKLLLKMGYKYYTKYYYTIFVNKLYQDLISVLKTFYQLQGNMSVSNSYLTMIDSSPNKYWKDLFSDIVLNTKNGGKASEILYSESLVLPEEIINCFVDAEDTGEFKVYINKALDYSIKRNTEITASIKEFAPIIVNFSLFVVIGLLVVSFVKDVMQNGLLDVMSSM